MSARQRSRSASGHCSRRAESGKSWRRGLIASLAGACLLQGCAAYAPPKPWEKGDLARPVMQFDADALDAKLEQHVYASKEATTGGYGVGGGGCGCN